MKKCNMKSVQHKKCAAWKEWKEQTEKISTWKYHNMRKNAARKRGKMERAVYRKNAIGKECSMKKVHKEKSAAWKKCSME